MKVVIVGGSNIDVFAVSDKAIIGYDSNPGKVYEAFGGVGRNIAENLGRLKCRPTLITAIGKNEIPQFKVHLDAAGVELRAIETNETSRYIAVLNNDYDMYVGISAMKVMEDLSIHDFKPYIEKIRNADIVVLDTNLEETVFHYLLKQCKNEIYIDGISTQKIQKIIPFLDRITVLKLNELEARSLFSDFKGPRELLIDKLKDTGINEIYLTVGKEGVYQIIGNNVIHQKLLPIQKAYTTGAGDAFLSGVVYGKITQKDALQYGILNARFCLNTLDAVNQELSIEKLEQLRRELYA